jgi:PAS domain S-box-containing protein
MHRLLTRQLHRHFGADFLPPPEWTGLLDLVSQAYAQSDSDRLMLERSLELSSQELIEFHLAEKETILRQQLENIERERKHFKALADTVPAGVLRLDSEENCNFVNQEWLKITGSSALRAAGRGWWDSIHPDDLALFRGYYARLVHAGIAFSCEHRIRTPDAEDLWVYCNAVAGQADEAGRCGYIFCMVDITERKKSLKQIERSQRLESIGVLAGGIAHDLNNALAPIHLGIGLFSKNISPEDRQLVDIISFSAARGSDLVRNLITFARGGTGARESISIGQLIAELILVIRASFPKNIEVTSSIPDQLPCLLANFTQIHQVLLNLAVNARDAMPEGGRLAFEARIVRLDAPEKVNLSVLEPGDHLLLTVADTGAGMTPEVLDHIFEPFYSTKKNGSGFGLSNVAGIIKEYKGDIGVSSLPGEGTTFEIYLPLHEQSLAPSPSAPSASAVEGGGRLVLVVDDEANIRDLLRLVLSKSNFQLIEASNGADALLKVHELKDSLSYIITDMHMPQLGGLGLARKVKQLLPDIPIIVMTGRLEAGEREQLVAQNITAIVEKPFSPKAILTALNGFERAPRTNGHAPSRHTVPVFCEGMGGATA